LEPGPSIAAGLDEAPAIVLYGKALGCHKLIGRELRHLTEAEADYHGTLQVALTQLRTMTRYVEELIQKHRATR